MNLSELIMRDTRANQPDPGIVGRLYYVADENILERDNGTAWENVEGVGGSSTETPSAVKIFVSQSFL